MKHTQELIRVIESALCLRVLGDGEALVWYFVVTQVTIGQAWRGVFVEALRAGYILRRGGSDGGE